MSNEESMTEAMEELFQSVLATPNHRRRLKSSIFWKRMGCKYRNPDRTKKVRELLELHSLAFSLRLKGSMDEVPDVNFGSEGKSVWIVLTYQEPVSPSVSSASDTTPVSHTTPPDSWFDKMAKIEFGPDTSEMDVMVKFIHPLFESLGYEDLDFAYSHSVVMYHGSKKVTKTADAVLFNSDDYIENSRSRENALILVEGKKGGKSIDKGVVLQARSYAMWLSPVYYVLTNGDDVEVYLYQILVTAKDLKVMSFKRADLKTQWSKLFKLLCKKRVLEIQANQRRIIADLLRLVEE